MYTGVTGLQSDADRSLHGVHEFMAHRRMDRVYKALKAQRMIAGDKDKTASMAWNNDGTSNKTGSHEGGTTGDIEKQFLLTVEHGEIQTTKRCLETAMKSDHKTFDINCVDPLGRSALLIAIDNENIDMIRLLLEFNVELGDALLHAIEEENVEAVEMLLQAHDKRREKQTVDTDNKITFPSTSNTSSLFTASTSYSADVSPLILAAHRNSYEIVKILLDRGDVVTKPHEVRCSCAECKAMAVEDSLVHSLSRINAYRALASPSLIALSSTDPILTAFELSHELLLLSRIEIEYRSSYEELAEQCQNFAVELLDQTRNMSELHTILNYDSSDTATPSGGHQNDNNVEQLDRLARLKLAVKYEQKRFVAHPNCQKLLASLWFNSLPGFQRQNTATQMMLAGFIGGLYPILSLLYIVTPSNIWLSDFMRRPFVKFLCHTTSYLSFILLIILSSQPIPGMNNREVRGALPSYIEWAILAFVVGQTWAAVKRLWIFGSKEFMHNMWNAVDFLVSALYIGAFVLKFVSYFQVLSERQRNDPSATIGRIYWDEFDPCLISEALFATANVFSILKLIQVFTISSHLGPLQLTLGRMVSDVLRFLVIASLVCFAFSCGINQLYSYYAQRELTICAEQCDFSNPLNNCTPCDRALANLFEVVQTLYFACYGLTGLSEFSINLPHQFTQFVGKLMFGCYCGCMIIILINMFIAILTLAYEQISDNADFEWKFARSKLWISYFHAGATVPPPFNVIPTPKTVWHICRWLVNGLTQCSPRVKENKWLSVKKQLKTLSEKEMRHRQVVSELIKRYVVSIQRREQHREVTEDDVNEIKHDISSLRYELLEVLSLNGMTLPSTAKTRRTSRRGTRGQRPGLGAISRLLQPNQQQSTDRQQQQLEEPSSNGKVATVDEAHSRTNETAENPVTNSVDSNSVLESDFVVSFDENAAVDEFSSHPEAGTHDGRLPHKQSKFKKQVAFHEPDENAEVHRADVDGDPMTKNAAVVDDQSQEDGGDDVAEGHSAYGIGKRGSKKRRSSRKKITFWKQHS